MKGVTYAKGVAAATVAAGPLVIATFISVYLLTRPTASCGLGTLAGMAFVMPVAAAFGAIAAIIHNLLGASLLAWLGRQNVGVRFWPFWAVAGAGLGWTIEWTVTLTDGTGAPGPMFALVGVPCALICRWGTRWSD